MENRVPGPWIFTALPPPPPPPPPSFFSTSKSKDTEPKKTFKCEVSLKDEQISLIKYMFCNPSTRIISYYRPLRPVEQEGPICGIVALSMASQCLKNVAAEELLENAKQLKFTKSGEMFSVHNMASLAFSSLNCDAIVISDLKRHKNSILTHICNGWPVLIAYDNDKNNEPCLNRGRSAHWAVISGLCFALPENDDLRFDIKFETVPPGSNVHVVDNGMDVKEFLSHALKVYVYAHQGKSRHLALWDLDLLLQSNNNLYEVSKKYGRDVIKVPENGSLSELRDKAILLKNKT